MRKIFRPHRRAIAPVIANMLIVAIAVIGGTITVGFAQNLTSSSQVSGHPMLELVLIPGFDGRDTAHLEVHDGNYVSSQMSGNYVNDGKKGKLERLAIYVKNNSPNTITISELRVAGEIFEYSNPSTSWIPLGKYAVLPYTSPEKLLENPLPQILSGQEVTIICSLDDSIKIGRSFQFRIVTTNGAIFTGTVTTGIQND